MFKLEIHMCILFKKKTTVQDRTSWIACDIFLLLYLLFEQSIW